VISPNANAGPELISTCMPELLFWPDVLAGRGAPSSGTPPVRAGSDG
jgi:hypothetical protein